MHVPVNIITQKTSDPEELFCCPYEVSHMISAKRFATHIKKCAKNHPHKQLETCPFNANHLLEPIHMRYHLSTCPDKYTLELQQQSEERFASTTQPTAASAQQDYDFDDDESWDEDIAEIKRSTTLGSFDKALLNGTAYKDKVTVERIKSKLKENQERASQAQALPARRPVCITGNKLSGAVGGVSRQPMSANNDGANSRMRPRLAANFAIRRDSSEGRGRGWFAHDRDSYAVGRGRALTALLPSSFPGYNSSSTVVNAPDFAATSEEHGDSDM